MVKLGGTVYILNGVGVCEIIVVMINLCSSLRFGQAEIRLSGCVLSQFSTEHIDLSAFSVL